MSQTRPQGWWMPEPCSRYGASNTPERIARFRFFASVAIKLWLLISASFAGLLWANHVSAGQVFFGSVLFGGGGGMLLLLVLCLAWCLD